MPRKYLLVASVILLVTVWFATGFHQGDEHFQILEFAIYKIGLVDGADLPWEFAERMRPALQPMLAYGAHRFLALFGDVDPFFLAGLLRFLSAALYLFVAVSLYNRYAPIFRTDQAKRWLALILLFSWCNVYAGVRFTSEWWSGAVFVLGFLAYPMSGLPEKRALPRVQSKDRGTVGALSAGILFGLSFEFRYQMALAVVGFGAWLLLATKPNWKHVAAMILGGLLMVAVGTSIDRWFYGEWVIAPWNYLAQNLIEGKAAGFGSKPWYGYVEYIFERGVPPLSLVYLAATGYFCWRYRKDPITWSFLAFFVAHSALARKDPRFLFPMLPFLAVAVAVSLRDLWRSYGDDHLATGWRKWVFGLLVFINIGLLASVTVRPMNEGTAFMNYIHDTYDEPVTLLADGEHIYSLSGLTVRFYQPERGIDIVQNENRDWPPCTTNICLYSERTTTPDPPPGARLVYTNEPFFYGYIDPFGLVSRHRWWYLYEL